MQEDQKQPVVVCVLSTSTPQLTWKPRSLEPFLTEFLCVCDTAPVTGRWADSLFSSSGPPSPLLYDLLLPLTTHRRRPFFLPLLGGVGARFDQPFLLLCPQGRIEIAARMQQPMRSRACRLRSGLCVTFILVSINIFWNAAVPSRTKNLKTSLAAVDVRTPAASFPRFWPSPWLGSLSLRPAPPPPQSEIAIVMVDTRDLLTVPRDRKGPGDDAFWYGHIVTAANRAYACRVCSMQQTRHEFSNACC